MKLTKFLLIFIFSFSLSTIISTHSLIFAQERSHSLNEPKAGPETKVFVKGEQGKKFQSDPRPLWELGIGFFTFNAPHYRGSDQSRTYFWPVPYFIYRGEVIQAQNTGISGYVMNRENVAINMSLNASLRVNSGKNRAREGMPSLDPTFELGPALTWDFLKSNDSKNILSLTIPLRTVVAANFFRAEIIGLFAVPYVAWSVYPQEKTFGLFSELTMAAMFGTKRFHDYYYGVSQENARIGRPTYYATGGYSGSHITWYLSKNFPKFHLRPL